MPTGPQGVRARPPPERQAAAGTWAVDRPRLP